MGILKSIIKATTKPLKDKRKGVIGEKKVNSQLNPLVFGKVEHKQINNLVLTDEMGKTHQIDHIEIRHNGIFCIETKNYSGWIFGDEYSDKWTQTLPNGSKFSFVSPIKQNKSHVYHLSKILNGKYKVNSLVVMVQNNADRINADNVINLNNIKAYLKDYNDGTNYTTEEMNGIYDLILSASSDVSNREHVKNIKKTQKDMHDGICPRCGGTLVERNGKYGKFIGCSNYPRCKFVINK